MPEKKSSRASDAPSAIPDLEPNMFRVALEASPSPMMAVREDGTLILVNQAAERLLGYEAQEMLGHSVEMFLPEGLRSTHKQHRAEYVDDPSARPMGSQRDLYAIRRDGSAVPIEIGLSPVTTSTGVVTICSIVDLTRRKEEEEDLLQLAASLNRKNERLLELVSTDGLTSLKSRGAFMDHLGAQMEISFRHGRPLSVLILDIDHFKAFNDTFGHLAGDEVLTTIGKTLRSVSRRSDLVARLGGEEFGIILPETDRTGAVVLAERFREAIEEEEWPLRSITVSIGSTTIHPGAADNLVPGGESPTIPSILTEADKALYRSKEEGRNRVTHSQDFG